MQSSTLRRILTWVFNTLTVWETAGTENVPAEGPFILATNHMSRVDVPLLFIATPRTDLVALVADSYKTNPFFTFLVVTTHSIWIDRNKADFTAMRSAMDHIRKGGALGIAPEGTRSRVKALLPAKSGVALLADKTRVPIVPAAISGTENTFLELFKFRKPRLLVRFGKPFTPPPVDRADREASLERNTEEIMLRIAAMLPDQYHGYYANHPRLKEFTP
jgi:1-acyl-sn-glycerol-3-phosphate acyltransferase